MQLINTDNWLPAKEAIILSGVNRKAFYEAVNKKIIRTKPAWDRIITYNIQDIKNYFKKL